MKLLRALLILSLGSVPVLAAEIHSENVDYPDGEVTLEGYLAYEKDQSGPRPGVLVVHEWWGLNDYAKRRARQLAEMGYVAFALDMYGKGRVTESSKEAGEWAAPFKNDRALARRRAQAGLDVLKHNALVNPAQSAAIGYCFGGLVVLELARGGADVSGVVSFHGGLDTPHPDDAKNIRAKILVCHGANDPYESAEQVSAFQKEMRDAGVDWQMIFYGGAVHAFTNPDAGDDPSKGVAYQAEADQRSWEAMRAFFSELFQE